MTSDQGLVVTSLIVNVISSVGIIFVNKELVFGVAGFRFGSLLTMIHFIATFLGCLFCMKKGWSQRKKLRLRSVFAISLAFCGYVVFNNLSLFKNSVTVYQISKIICTPVIVLIEYRMYRNPLPRLTIVALCIVCLGSILTVGSDTSLTPVGLLWCLLAILSNSFYTVWGKSMQVELHCTPMQLLSYQAPLSAVMLLFTFPVLDNAPELWEYSWTWTTFWCIGLSCVFAFGVNFSFFVFVGKTSGLTVNVLGYLKTSLVLILSWIFNSAAVNVSSVVGTLLTLLGLALYMVGKSRAQTRKAVQ